MEWSDVRHQPILLEKSWRNLTVWMWWILWYNSTVMMRAVQVLCNIKQNDLAHRLELKLKEGKEGVML